MDKNNLENLQKISPMQNDVSPISKMKIIAADRTRKESQYWIEHFKYKQNLINQLEMLKNEKPEKSTKTSQISQFQKEQEILCDNLYKLNQITKYSQIKLGTNFNKMKKIESNEEAQKQRLKIIFEKNIEKIKEIEKIQDDIYVQKQLLNAWDENVEKMKNDISNTRKENANAIDNLCAQYSIEDKEFKNNTKMFNLLCNITKYTVINIEKDENMESQEVKGYLLNASNGNVPVLIQHQTRNLSFNDVLQVAVQLPLQLFCVNRTERTCSTLFGNGLITRNNHFVQAVV